jgi:mannose-6-phosphate isomerase-like protein (cupin superfamily)
VPPYDYYPMLFRSMFDVEAFTAGDHTQIREVLHPKNDAIDVPYSLALAELGPGESSTPHILSASSELYVILKGAGTAFVGDQSFSMKAGDLLLIPAGARQYFRNDGEDQVQFLCIVAPPWSAEQEEVEE